MEVCRHILKKSITDLAEISPKSSMETISSIDAEINESIFPKCLASVFEAFWPIFFMPRAFISPSASVPYADSDAVKASTKMFEAAGVKLTRLQTDTQKIELSFETE